MERAVVISVIMLYKGKHKKSTAQVTKLLLKLVMSSQ